MCVTTKLVTVRIQAQDRLLLQNPSSCQCAHLTLKLTRKGRRENQWAWRSGWLRRASFTEQEPFCLGHKEEHGCDQRAYPPMAPGLESVTKEDGHKGLIPSSVRTLGCLFSAEIPWMVGKREWGLGEVVSFAQGYSLPVETKDNLSSLCSPVKRD